MQEADNWNSLSFYPYLYPYLGWAYTWRAKTVLGSK